MKQKTAFITGINVFDVKGGPYNCYSGVLSSYSMSISPYSVVQCQMEVDFFGGYNQDGDLSGIEAGTGYIQTDRDWETPL